MFYVILPIFRLFETQAKQISIRKLKVTYCAEENIILCSIKKFSNNKMYLGHIISFKKNFKVSKCRNKNILWTLYVYW